MNELIDTHDYRATIRWKLLTGASVLALTVSSASIAKAEDATQPQIWIELGGQLSRLNDGQEAFEQNFPNSPPRPSIFSPSQKFECPPLYSIDEEGKLSFEPEGSDWIFSASVRYGRSAAHRDARQQTYPKGFSDYGTRSGQRYVANYVVARANRFADTTTRISESHGVLDFQAGKDVGLGMLGSHHGSSVLNFGVRFAQFTGKSDIALKSDPDWHISTKYVFGKNLAIGQPYHSNQANLQASRSFHGIGPSLSWNASAPLAGTAQDSELTLDWGIDAAMLFGRQRAKVHHDAMAQYHPPGPKYAQCYGCQHITYNPAPVNVTRSRSVTVPNVGGFAGLSFRYADAKISLGYRGDFFFGAMDGGIDTRKNENRAFFGPFASISVGLGD